MAKQAVFRERNKRYYRVLHTPIWIWVFWVLPGWPLTYDLYTHGPDRRHWIWLAIILAFVAWRGLAGRLPGCEPRPYITHYGVHQPNLWYRVVCYTAAWVDIIVPYALNLIGLIIASINGRWILKDLYHYGYYPLALAVVLATVFDWIPRAKRDTFGEGAERAWFYVAIWTVVPTQVINWGAWRFGKFMDLSPLPLARVRLVVCLLSTAFFFLLGYSQRLPRTTRHYEGVAAAGV